MKSVVDIKPTPARNYPYIGINSKSTGDSIGKVVVLFHAERRGIVIANLEDNPRNNKVGYYSETWLDKAFEPYEGTITLSND